MPSSGTARASALLAAAFVLRSVPSSAGTAADLKLQELTAQRLVISAKSNPHDAFACTECHRVTPARRPWVDESPSQILDEYPEDLCRHCHPGSCPLHPQDVILPGGGLPADAAYVFPVRRFPGGETRLSCMSCHNVHYPHTGFRLLRGFAINPLSQPSAFFTRLDFCRSCHGERVSSFSSHAAPSPEGTGCVFCHVAPPAGGGQPSLRAEVNVVCTYCHPVTPEPHYVRYNPFPGMTAEEIAAPGTFLRGGAYTCLTCHSTHGRSTLQHLLTPQFLAAARSSTLIKPHGREAFCQCCHAGTPPPHGLGRTPAPLVEKDTTVLCNRCHGTGKISGMWHPLRPLPAAFRKPPGLPLAPDGRLTCTTCHDAGHAPIAASNKTFLRVSIANSVTDLCFLCHDPITARNPHVEYQSDTGCDLCHAQGDRFTMKNLAVGDVLADPNFLCLRCHEWVDHPASSLHVLRPGQYEFVRVDAKEMKLDRFGRITCYTCHQVHQHPAADRFLRTTASHLPADICRNCHPF